LITASNLKIKFETDFSHNLIIQDNPSSDGINLKINLLNTLKINKDFVSGDRIFFNKADIAAYEILEGKVINIYPNQHINTDTLLYYALQIPFGCACAQNNKLVFHASVAEKGGKCFAFLGAPGAGKSSILMKLLGSGWNFITEDVCVIDDSNNLSFISSFPYIKLSDEVAKNYLDQLVATDIKTDKANRNTYRIDASSVSLGGALESIFFLDWSQDSNLYKPAESTKLRLLLNYLIPSFQSKANGLHIDSYKKILELMDLIPMFILERPRSLDSRDIQTTINTLNSLT
jgi:hypothetical protein